MSTATTNNNGDTSSKTGQGTMSRSNTPRATEGTRSPANGASDGTKPRQAPRAAWQGPNPITQRSSNGVVNGADKPSVKSATPAKAAADSHADKHAHDRILFVLAQAMGNTTTIALKNGEQFEGLLSGGTFEASKTHFVLKMAKRKESATHTQMNGDQSVVSDSDAKTMTFDLQDIVHIALFEVPIAPAASTLNGSASTSFRTDTQISNRDRPREHELQRWEPTTSSTLDMSLEDSGSGGWDQFAANANMYGVESTYDENQYTTALNRSHPQYKQRQAEADRIAREIENSIPADAHVAEERRRDTTQDDGGDEEDKYSGVRRDVAQLPRRTAGAYVPPSQRPITGAPTVPGAPYDPAIISSQLSQPQQNATSQNDPAQAPKAPPASGTEQTQLKDSTNVAIPAPTVPAPITESLPKKSREVTTEEHVRETVDAFKVFVNNEKLRVRQAQEAKKSSARQEKNVKLNDLKKFAENFKLKSRVPDDLVPILAKDREKQLEIQSKAEAAAKEEEQKTKEKSNAANTGTASQPASASTTSTTTTAAPSLIPADQRAHQNRPRPAQQTRTQPSIPPYYPGQSPRVPLNQRNPSAQFSRPPIMPISGQSPIPPDQPHSPTSTIRLNGNAKAFEFRPGVAAFAPSGASPSPQRSLVNADFTRPSPKSFFEGNGLKKLTDIKTLYAPITRLASAEYLASLQLSDGQKRAYTNNGDFPLAYNTAPTWEFKEKNKDVGYMTNFLRSSSLPTPGPSPGMNVPIVPMPNLHHQFQPPPGATPPQRAYYPQHQPPPGPPMFNPQYPNYPNYRMSPTMLNRSLPGGMPQHNYNGPPMMMHPQQMQPGIPPQQPGGMPHQFQPQPMMPQQYVTPGPYRSPGPFRQGQPQFPNPYMR